MLRAIPGRAGEGQRWAVAKLRRSGATCGISESKSREYIRCTGHVSNMYNFTQDEIYSTIRTNENENVKKNELRSVVVFVIVLSHFSPMPTLANDGCRRILRKRLPLPLPYVIRICRNRSQRSLQCLLSALFQAHCHRRPQRLRVRLVLDEFGEQVLRLALPVSLGFVVVRSTRCIL